MDGPTLEDIFLCVVFTLFCFLFLHYLLSAAKHASKRLNSSMPAPVLVFCLTTLPATELVFALS